MESSPNLDKPWLSTPVIIMIFIIVTMLSSLGGWLVFRQKADRFQPLEKYVSITPAEVNEVITSGVRLDKKVTVGYLRQKIGVAQFQSQGTSYTAFRLSSPETCGKLGCLHVIKPKDGALIHLQLLEIDPAKEMFKASLKPHCFVVVQPQDGIDKDFYVCEKP
jgi:hypothetical protein